METAAVSSRAGDGAARLRSQYWSGKWSSAIYSTALRSAVFLAALFADIAADVPGMAHYHSVSATLGIASIVAVISYGVFRQVKLVKRSKSDGLR